ncbi:MAG: NAD-dependent epimerase/dehydratase family protein [Methanobacteriota archaeon]
MESIKGSKILVTGGAGFIGSHIVESLVKLGMDVIVYDNFSSGREENLAKVWEDITVVRDDILDYENLKLAVDGVDFISHQAAQLEIFKCIDDPVRDLETNTIGTLNVLRSALECGVRKVVNASSACVYGQAESIPESEAEHPTNPNWAYGVSKLAAEKYCNIYSEYEGIPTVNLRYAIVYGPREWFGRVLTIFIKRLLAGEAPVVFGNGKQLRDFVYVGDVVEMHNTCLRSSKADNETYNVSTSIGTDVSSLAKKVITSFESDLEPIYEDVGEGQFSKHVKNRKRIPAELTRMVLDNSKALAELGWKPQVDLDEGIRREIEWARNNKVAWDVEGEIKV